MAQPQALTQQQLAPYKTSDPGLYNLLSGMGSGTPGRTHFMDEQDEPGDGERAEVLAAEQPDTTA